LSSLILVVAVEIDTIIIIYSSIKSSPPAPETTEVLYGNDNIQRRTLETFSRLKDGVVVAAVDGDEIEFG
jgi:hypothetical protein